MRTILTLLGVLTLWALPLAPAGAQMRPEDALQEMQQAQRKNDRARLSALAPQVQGHALEPLAAYWELRARLEQADPADIQAFVQRHAGTYYEDRLRNDALLMWGRKRDWPAVAAAYAHYRMRDDKEAHCYALAADMVLQRRDVSAQALGHWHAQRDADDGCTWLAEQLYNSQKISANDVWRKARLATEGGRQRAAKDAVAMVAPDAATDVAALWAEPARYLKQRGPALGRTRKELAALALIRLASTDPEQAQSALLERWDSALGREEKNWAWAAVGKQWAQKLSPKASEAFARVSPDSDLSDELLTWKIRAALRADQWGQVLAASAALNEPVRHDPAWVYWHARALAATAADAQTRQRSREMLRSIASVRGFYEQLALEELGQAITLPSAPAPLTVAEKQAALTHPGLQRALLAIELGLRAEGVREWNYTTNLHTPGGMGERELLAAADLACQRQVWDRCINTSERTPQAVHMGQRYPTPLRDAVLRRTQAIGLEPAYVYGLIRQESRFIMDARSHVGASGLMQVMPATAKWTAKKIGMTDFVPSQITDKEVNIAIGTGYLKLVLDDFGGAMPLAAAAYNAGPGRARRWREGPVLEGAVWAENIPFQETRDYVKKVLANTTAYAALLTGQPQSLKARMGQIGPRAPQAAAENTELP